MRASVVVRSKDEADRLRLTLTSLALQTEPPQVVVVNDGSSDHTRDVIAEASATLDLVAVHHATARGRSAAANAGAERADGDVVIFLDGDTLAARDLVALHLEEHRRSPKRVVRGETWHLRCTRWFLDPQTGSPQPGGEARIERMTAAERARSLVTQAQVRDDFAAIERRAEPGIYPGFGPRKLYELEMDALRTDPESNVLWVAASGSNQSVSRSAFLDAGGFHPALTINEHRELALRLVQRGLRMAAVSARAYHLTHRSGWRDPLQDTVWERIFYDAHPLPEVALLPFLWESLSDQHANGGGPGIRTLADLSAAAQSVRGVTGLEHVRAAYKRRFSDSAPA